MKNRYDFKIFHFSQILRSRLGGWDCRMQFGLAPKLRRFAETQQQGQQNLQGRLGVWDMLLIGLWKVNERWQKIACPNDLACLALDSTRAETRTPIHPSGSTQRNT